eukprot:gene2305-24908_t
MFGKIVERTDQGLHYRCNGVVYTGIDIQASLFAIHVHGNPRVREEYSTLDTLDALDATPEPTSMLSSIGVQWSIFSSAPDADFLVSWRIRDSWQQKDQSVYATSPSPLL